jgi:phosphotransferase system HPr (HPr) family protein
MQMRTLTIANPRGLHAQACARIVDIAKRFRCNVSIVAKGQRVRARNVFAVMLITASFGATIRIEADGPDEAIAMREIATLFHDGLGERR